MLLFSVSGIISVPGILIVVGVILLIVALVLFITTSKNNKGLVDKPITVSDGVSAPDPVVSTEPIQATPVQEVKVEESKIDEVKPVDVSANSVPIIEESKVEQPVTVSMDVPEVQPEVKVEESISTTQPEVSPVVEEAKVVEKTPSVEIPSVEEVTSAPVVEPTVSEEPVSIYGGASPNVEVHEEPKQHQIYGGADPMEKTQTIPVINPTAEAYGGNGITEAKIVDQKTDENKDVEVLDF